MELLPTSLAQLLLQEAQNPTSLSIRLRWAQQVASAMRYCHSTRPVVLHLDLKSSNIMISGGNDDSRFAKVTDFGTAKILESSPQSAATPASMHITSLHVTELWAAPELLRDRVASTNADVYSFGVVLWELLQATGEAPYVVESRQFSKPMLIQKIMSGDVRLSNPTSNASGGVSVEVLKLMTSCTSFESSQRPPFREIYQTLQKALATESFVFVFTKPSRFLLDYFGERFGDFGLALPYGPEEDIISDSALIVWRNARQLVIVPQRSFESRKDAEQNRDQLVESLPDSSEDDDESLFETCTVESKIKYGFLN